MPEVPSRRHSRSRSPKPSERPRRDYLTASPSLGTCSSPAAHSRPSRFAVLRQKENVVASNTHPSTSGLHVDLQNTTGSSVSGGILDDYSGRTPPTSQFNQPGASNLNLGTNATAHSAHQHSTFLAYVPDRSDSSQFQQSPYNAGIFNQARDFTVTGTFVDGSTTIYNNASVNQFMKDFLEETIRGAEFDSSDRDPPPRCLPGTRLAVLERCLYFISNCEGVKKMRWVVGAAGVGKSAIMQSVAESPDLPVGSPASVFFSINRRDDGTKTIKTLSYQFAAKSDSYRQVIEGEITRDPSLIGSSMAKQFNRLIIEPFIHNNRLNSAGRVLVIIDGLDECKDHHTQLELLRLISDLCLTHPSSSLVWLIASRPEPQITSFFSRLNVIPAYEKEEIPVNSDEARADVERFLRVKLTEIKEESDSLDPRWPEERDFWKVANAAGGLFAYAQTVTRYIGDRRIGSPVLQLSDVLHVIDEHPMTGLSREEHPMALLDALYERILSNVPDKIMINTRRLLLSLASGRDISLRYGSIDMSFVVLCNWLGMTADEAYAAVYHLRSVLFIPQRDRAYQGKLAAFHKSLMDYISDFMRSGFSTDFPDEARILRAECTFRILNEVPDGIELNVLESDLDGSTLASGPVTRNKISLTWPIEGVGSWDNDKTRLNVYKLAVEQVVNGMKCGDPTFQTEFYIHFLTTVWSFYSFTFPYQELLNVAFAETRRLEFMTHGILKPMPLEDVAISKICNNLDIKLQICRPATTVVHSSGPWNSSCLHKRKADCEGGNTHGWTATFRKPDFFTSILPGNECAFCYERLQHQLKNWKGHSSEDPALVLFTSTGHCCVQVRLVDPEDGMAEWTYSFWCDIPSEMRAKHASAV